MEDIDKLLEDLPVFGLGQKFLIVTRKSLVESFVKSVSLTFISSIINSDITIQS